MNNNENQVWKNRKSERGNKYTWIVSELINIHDDKLIRTAMRCDVSSFVVGTGMHKWDCSPFSEFASIHLAASSKLALRLEKKQTELCSCSIRLHNDNRWLWIGYQSSINHLFSVLRLCWISWRDSPPPGRGKFGSRQHRIDSQLCICNCPCDPSNASYGFSNPHLIESVDQKPHQWG